MEKIMAQLLKQISITMLEKGVDWLLGWKSCQKFILLPKNYIVQNVDKILQFFCDFESGLEVIRRVIWIKVHQNLLFFWSSTYLESVFGNETHLRPLLLTYQVSCIPAKQKWRWEVRCSGRQNVLIGCLRILCNPSKTNQTVIVI